MFYIDRSERSYIRDALRKAGLEIFERSLNDEGLGDFYWEGKNKKYSVEHKSVRSLLPEFMDRGTRQLVNQVDTAQQMGDTVIALAIEGVCSADKDGLCQVHQKRRERESYEVPIGQDRRRYKYNISFNAWTAWKVKILTSGVLVLEYPDSAALAAGMFALYQQTYFKDITAPFKYNAIQDHRNNYQMAMLLQVPGIGRVKARELLNHYGSLYGVLSSSPNDWPLRTPSWNEFAKVMGKEYKDV